MMNERGYVPNKLQAELKPQMVSLGKVDMLALADDSIMLFRDRPP